MTRIWALIPLIVAAGCGGGDTPSAGDKACQDLAAKLKECNLTAVGACDTSEPCTVECAAKADCAQLLHASMPSGTQLTCVAACIGLTPDQVFVCKDGTAIIDKRAVCDGHALCPDGSDEANCGGVSKDAGKD